MKRKSNAVLAHLLASLDVMGCMYTVTESDGTFHSNMSTSAAKPETAKRKNTVTVHSGRGKGRVISEVPIEADLERKRPRVVGTKMFWQELGYDKDIQSLKVGQAKQFKIPKGKGMEEAADRLRGHLASLCLQHFGAGTFATKATKSNIEVIRVA